MSANPVSMVASEVSCLSGERFDLRAIGQAMSGLRHNMGRINHCLDNDQADLDRQSVDQIVRAYALLDHYVSMDLRLLAMGHSREVLKLNHCVLFGQEDVQNPDYRKALRASEKHFYRVGESGIGNMIEWYSQHRYRSVWRRAAGVYLNTVGPPQLFLEGNHRTGVLLANYVLARANKPPLVLDAQLASSWFRLTEQMRERRGHFFDLKYWFRSLDSELANFIQEHVNKRYLRSDSSIGG